MPNKYHQKAAKGSKGQPLPSGSTGSDALPSKAVGYPEDLGKAQPKDRSLGYKRIGCAMAKKGL